MGSDPLVHTSLSSTHICLIDLACYKCLKHLCANALQYFSKGHLDLLYDTKCKGIVHPKFLPSFTNHMHYITSNTNDWNLIHYSLTLFLSIQIWMVCYTIYEFQWITTLISSFFPHTKLQKIWTIVQYWFIL